MSDEVDSLHADKYESLLQIDTLILIFDGDDQALPKFPKQQVYNVFAKSQNRY